MDALQFPKAVSRALGEHRQRIQGSGRGTGGAVSPTGDVPTPAPASSLAQPLTSGDVQGAGSVVHGDLNFGCTCPVITAA